MLDQFPVNPAGALVPRGTEEGHPHDGPGDGQHRNGGKDDKAAAVQCWHDATTRERCLRSRANAQRHEGAYRGSLGVRGPKNARDARLCSCLRRGGMRNLGKRQRTSEAGRQIISRNAIPVAVFDHAK